MSQRFSIPKISDISNLIKQLCPLHQSYLSYQWYQHKLHQHKIYPNKLYKLRRRQGVSNRHREVTTSQQGAGLIEVLVALLLLSTTALGYTALQAHSLSSVDDALMRMQALLILTETAQRIRVNQNVEDIAVYQQLLAAPTAPKPLNCMITNGCQPSQVASNDVASLRQQASEQGIRLAMVVCPGTQYQGKTSCLVAAWHNTEAGYATTTNDLTAAINEGRQGCFHVDGSYLLQADCVYREAY
ncbi:type IV pilus modification PilV family protein [Psychrobacter lutiphocae]|uniref:type IV pilus modification PilV family protein n=1 Tax=Psychrobacter lutiphocae TaxID=540500 RepID=UPI00035D6140|nr:hypothetical protein [Psychrobacter lutiphocae]